MNSRSLVKMPLAVFMLATGMVPGGARAVEAQEDGAFRNTKKQGQAVAEYRDPEIHVVIAYAYSQQNHDSRWLLIETAMSTARNMTIDRRNIALVTPAGRRVPLATQERFAA